MPTIAALIETAHMLWKMSAVEMVGAMMLLALALRVFVMLRFGGALPIARHVARQQELERQCARNGHVWGRGGCGRCGKKPSA